MSKGSTHRRDCRRIILERRSRFLALCAGAGLTTSTARADDSSTIDIDATSPSAQEIQVSGPLLSPCLSIARPGTWSRTHDGFYLRGGVGTGLLLADQPSLRRTNTRVTSLALDLKIGMTLWPQIESSGDVRRKRSAGVLGTSVQYVLRPDCLDETNSSCATWIAGPFVDYFPSDRGGFHSGAGLGIAGLSLGASSQAPAWSGVGFGGSVWIGYDAPLTRQLWLGLTLQQTAAGVSGDGQHAVARSLSLLVSLLDH